MVQVRQEALAKTTAEPAETAVLVETVVLVETAVAALVVHQSAY